IVVGRERDDAVSFDQIPRLKERHAHGYPEGLAFKAAADHISIIIRKHHDGLARERGLKGALTRNVKLIAVDQAEQLLPAFTHPALRPRSHATSLISKD